MQRARMVILALIIALLNVFINGCSTNKEPKEVLESFNTETSQKPPYVQYNTFVFGDITLDFDALLKENNINGNFHEVYVVQDDVIFFGYSEAARNQNGGKEWHIATITIEQRTLDSIYHEEFCVESNSDQHYVQKNNSHSQNRYTTANGFYYNNKIVLTDRVKLIEYDLTTRSAKVYAAQSYEYPTMPVVEIVDYQTISFSRNSQQKIFGVTEGKQTSAVFREMLELQQKINWNGESLLSDLFDKVQIVNNQIYIMCRVMNWNGETYAVVYLYDFEANSCQYTFSCFMGDLIANNLYIVPKA